MMMSKVSSLKEKLEYLKTYDKYYTIFGSCEHKYLLNEPLSEDELCEFEAKHNIKLPSQYRDFLKYMGNGGAGPCYGIYGLKSDVDYSDLSKLFLLNNDFDIENYPDEYPCVVDENLDCDECEKQEKCLMNFNYERYKQGILDICHAGCEGYEALVISDESESVWSIWEYHSVKKREKNFLTWYEYWLDNSISEIKPMVDAVTGKEPVENIMKLCDVFFDYNKYKLLASLLKVPNYQVLTDEQKEQIIQKYIEYQKS